MGEKQGIDWTTLWKKDDWMSVWIGFLILIVFIAGLTFKLPSWKWMTDGAFSDKIGGWQKRVEAVSKDAGAKADAGVMTEAGALKAALDAGDRQAIGAATAKLEKAAASAVDKDVKKNADKLAKDIKG